jgi:hypothetical protein
MSKKTKLELTWIGKEHRPKLEPRILLEEADKSHHAAHRVTDRDLFDNRLIHGDNLLALTLEDKLASQKQIKNVEAQRNDKRRSLFEAQDAIDQQREDLIGKIEGKLQQDASTQALFTLRWSLV